MSFYGKDPEPKQDDRIKTFWWRNGKYEKPHKVTAHHIFFYDSGHFGFWNNTDDGKRVLVLAVKADEVWEEVE